MTGNYGDTCPTLRRLLQDLAGTSVLLKQAKPWTRNHRWLRAPCGQHHPGLWRTAAQLPNLRVGHGQGWRHVRVMGVFWNRNGLRPGATGVPLALLPTRTPQGGTGLRWGHSWGPASCSAFCSQAGRQAGVYHSRTAPWPNMQGSPRLLLTQWEV